ncbi:unnamed protein product [Rotaria sp. Silwood1]|nr:unnamed protein product [Rotaria sp. Silwood1]
MSSASLLEQLTSSVSMSMLAIVSIAILVLLLIYTVACRIIFSSSKSKTSTSKQHSNKDKKSKETNTIKKQQIDITSTNKKKNNKVKKNVLPVSTTSSQNTQSEESENEKSTFVVSSKKSTSASKKVVVTDENNQTSPLTNAIKTSSTKKHQTSVRAENVQNSTEGQNEDNNKKQLKTNAAPTSTNTIVASNKKKPSGKRDGNTKVNTANSKKNESVPINAESKRNLTIDVEVGSDQEDEGQWLIQGSKQVNHRNRNKGKNETSNINNQPLSNNYNVVSEQLSNSNTSSSINNNELYIETTTSLINDLTSSIEDPEPIEICQLLPTNENLYTSNDNWWKQALNKQQTFSIDDIGEWPEREQDEQYIVQIKRIIPVKKLNEKQKSDDK